MAISAAMGCRYGSPPPTTPAGAGHDGHSHSHDHAHVGPHGGHLLELQPEGYHAEWIHDDEGRVTVFLLDAAAEAEAPVAGAEVAIDVTIDGNTATYVLEPVHDSTASTGPTAEFFIIDKQLVPSLQIAGEGVDAVLKLKIDDQQYSGQFEHEPH
jgi:hypothetical protein